jgi:hypothetical protein
MDPEQASVLASPSSSAELVDPELATLFSICTVC